MNGVLRHALLALLAEEPRSGYDLTQMFDRTLGHAWSARHSQIYPELARLRDAGLIRQVGAGPRDRKLYEATDEGRAEVRRWLTDEEPDQTFRNEAILRTFFLWLLPLEERRAFLKAERARRARLLDEYEEMAKTRVFETAPRLSSRIALEFGIRYERMFVEWVDWALPRLRELDRD